MDDRRFDALAKALAKPRSRRRFLATFAGGVVGAVGALAGGRPIAARAAPGGDSIEQCSPCLPACHAPFFCACGVCTGVAVDDPPICAPVGCEGRCGIVDNGCGGAIECDCCIPLGCGERCGIVDDGCGDAIECECCVPVGCEGRCGAIDDGCGGTIDCGCCPRGCDGRCGVVPNGCVGTLDCGACAVNPTEPDILTQPPGTGERYVVLLDSFHSSSLLDDQSGESNPDNHGVRDRFAPIVQRLTEADPAPRVIYFSYRLGLLLADGVEPERAWTGRRFEAGREPVYRSANVTDRPLQEHVAGLEWIVATLREQNPNSTVDVVGFGLGGIVALAWVADQVEAADGARANHLDAIGRVVVLDCPAGGFNPALAIEGAVPELEWHKLDFGKGVVLKDLTTTSERIKALPAAAERIDAASIENRDDYLINAKNVLGVGVWLGKGTADLLPTDRRYEESLGKDDADLIRTHRMILESQSAIALQARDRLVALLA